jgi:hypothetical protein
MALEIDGQEVEVRALDDFTKALGTGTSTC